METGSDFIFLGFKITTDCIHEIKRCLLFGRKAMTNIDNVLQRRDITLLTKVHIVKVMVFPVVIYRCENCIIKEGEHLRTFELQGWRRLLDCKEFKLVNSKGNQP